MEWKMYRIADIGKVVGGGTPTTAESSFWGGNIAWISPKDLTGYNSVYISHGENFITEKGLNKSGAKLLPKNTLLFSSRAPIGYLAIASNPICTNQGFKNIICDENIVISLFLYYYIKQNLEYIKLFGTGATFPEISANALSKIKIFLPPLPTQRKIASILSTYDSLIENNAKRIRLLEQMAENLYKEWFVRFRFPGYEKTEFVDGLPKDWLVKKYEEITEVVAGGDCPPICADIPTENVCIPIYSNGITNDGLYGYTDKERISKPCITISARGTIGYVCLRLKPFVPIVRLLAIIPQKISVYYLFHYSKYNNLEGNGTSQQQLTKPMLLKKKLIVPSQSILVKFDMIVENLYMQKRKYEEQNKLLARQRDLLLPRLMSGKQEVKA